MIANIVNADDLQTLLRAVARPRWGSSRFHLRRHERVLATWGSVRTTTSHWFDLPQVVEHRRARAAAGRGHDHVERFVGTHLDGRDGLRGLSVGCGTGAKELRWASTGRFAQLDAFDLSEDVVAAAEAAADAAGFSDVLHFSVRNFFEMDLPDCAYDVVIFEDSLHHLSPLTDAIERAESLLGAGGYLVVHEYVGPNRLQMPQRTRDTANALLAAIPARHRIRTDGRLKSKVTVPSRLRMIMRDPSEAPESASMLRILGERFETLDLTPVGGTLVYPLLDEIAQNFVDPGGQRILSALLTLEDELIDSGELASDYVFATYRRR